MTERYFLNRHHGTNASACENVNSARKQGNSLTNTFRVIVAEVILTVLTLATFAQDRQAADCQFGVGNTAFPLRVDQSRVDRQCTGAEQNAPNLKIIFPLYGVFSLRSHLFV